MAKLTPESAWEFADAIKAIVKPQTTRRKATVQSVDKDGTVWVNLPGSSTVTPIQSTGANVSPGDTVLTELRGTSLHITENQTNPAIGENTARSIARQETQHAEAMAKQAQTIADEAQAVAEATNQHFFTDDNGAHITDVTQDEWTQAVADEFSDYDPTTKPYHNQLLNSLGILLRTALNNLVSITRSAIAFYDGTGNAASNIVARFGSDGAQVGLDSAENVQLSPTGIRLNQRGVRSFIAALTNKTGNARSYTPVQSETVELSRTQSHVYTIPEIEDVPTAAPASSHFNLIITAYRSDQDAAQSWDFAFQLTKGNLGGGGTSPVISGISFTFRYDGATGVTVTNNSSDIVLTVSGLSYLITARLPAFTLGEPYSEDYLPGAFAFSAGRGNKHGGFASAAIGQDNISSGDYSRADGLSAIASGYASHAQNEGTKAASEAQTAMGKYNVEDANDVYALIIGNGTADNARSNAFAVTWDGDIETAKDTAWITLNGTIKYRIHHGVCYVCGDSVSGGTSVGTSGTNVGTLPAGARPSITVTGAASTKSNTANGQFSIDSSGVIKVWNLSTTSPYWCFTAAFPVG